MAEQQNFSETVSQHVPFLKLPNTAYEARERDVLVRHAVSRLPKSYRSVVELCDLERVSLKEAAVKLGLTVPAANTRLHRARKKLRPLITKLNLTA